MKSYLVAEGTHNDTFGGGVIQEVARGLLSSGLVSGVACFVRGLDAQDVRPALLDREDDLHRITLSTYNPYGLAGFVKKYAAGKVCLIARTCDVRAAIELAKRNQLNLEDIYTIGVACTEPMETLAGDKRPNCLRCEHVVPHMADLCCLVTGKATIVEAAGDKGGKALAAARVKEVTAFDPGYDFEGLRKTALDRQEHDFALLNLSPTERLSYWLTQFDRCVKCYGCRNSCPVCYCRECVLEGDRGVVPGGEVAPDTIFHLTRLAHVADSCVNCGRCDDACPMDIPISKLYHMLHKELCAVFGHESGMDMSPPPLVYVAPGEQADIATLFEGGGPGICSKRRWQGVG